MKANPQTSPNETNRTVLMVDGHGRIRTIHKFHQKLGIGIAMVVVALLAAAGAFWMYIGGLQVQAELRQQIDALRAQVAEAEHQQELLLARAVKAEARVAAGDPQGASSAAAPVAPPVASASAKSKRPSPKSVAAIAGAPAVEVKPAKAAPSKPAPAPKPEPVISVVVDKFEVVYLEAEKALAADFIIRNTGNAQAQGRTVVVLSSTDDAATPRLTLPPVPLRDDRPRGNRGRRFSITRFMQVKLQRKVAEPGLQFDSADVFVFNMQGKLLQEKTFKVAVRIPEEKPPVPAAVVAPVPAAVVAPVAPAAPGPDQHPDPNLNQHQDPNPDQKPEPNPVANPILAIPANSGQETQGGQEE